MWMLRGFLWETWEPADYVDGLLRLRRGGLRKELTMTSQPNKSKSAACRLKVQSEATPGLWIGGLVTGDSLRRLPSEPDKSQTELAGSQV